MGFVRCEIQWRQGPPFTEAFEGGEFVESRSWYEVGRGGTLSSIVISLKGWVRTAGRGKDGGSLLHFEHKGAPG